MATDRDKLPKQVQDHIDQIVGAEAQRQNFLALTLLQQLRDAFPDGEVKEILKKAAYDVTAVIAGSLGSLL